MKNTDEITYEIKFEGEPLALKTIYKEDKNGLVAFTELLKDPKYKNFKLFEANTIHQLSNSNNNISLSHSIIKTENAYHIETSEETSSRVEKWKTAERYRRETIKEFFLIGDAFCDRIFVLRTILYQLQNTKPQEFSITVLDGKSATPHGGDKLISQTILLLDDLLQSPYHLNINTTEIDISTDELYDELLKVLCDLMQTQVEDSNSLPPQSTVHTKYLRDLAELMSNQPAVEKLVYDIIDQLSLTDLHKVLDAVLENLKDTQERDRLQDLVSKEKDENSRIKLINRNLKSKIHTGLSASFLRPVKLMEILKIALEQQEKFLKEDSKKFIQPSANYIEQEDRLKAITTYCKAANRQMENAVEGVIKYIKRDEKTEIYNPQLFYLVGVPQNDQHLALMQFIAKGNFAYKTILPEGTKIIKPENPSKDSPMEKPEQSTQLKQLPFQKELSLKLQARERSSSAITLSPNIKKQPPPLPPRKYSTSSSSSNALSSSPLFVKISNEDLRKVQLKPVEKDDNKKSPIKK